MMQRIICLFIALIVLPSCIYVQKYPKTWSLPLATDDDCTSIAGVYDNKGEEADGHKVRLDLTLYPTWDMVYNRSITHVELRREDSNTVKIILWSKDKIASEKSYDRTKGEFICESGWLLLDEPAHSILSKFVLGVNWRTNSLSKNQDRYLIMRSRDVGIGLFAIIPVAGGGRVWLRFKSPEDISQKTLLE